MQLKNVKNLAVADGSAVLASGDPERALRPPQGQHGPVDTRYSAPVLELRSCAHERNVNDFPDWIQRAPSES